jgi:hypothetical protein
MIHGMRFRDDMQWHGIHPRQEIRSEGFRKATKLDFLVSLIF